MIHSVLRHGAVRQKKRVASVAERTSPKVDVSISGITRRCNYSELQQVKG
jgi:hypothetical protein